MCMLSDFDRCDYRPNPIHVVTGASLDTDCKAFGNLIGMKDPDTGLERWIGCGGGLDHELNFKVMLQPPLPLIHRLNTRNQTHAGRKPT